MLQALEKTGEGLEARDHPEDRESGSICKTGILPLMRETSGLWEKRCMLGQKACDWQDLDQNSKPSAVSTLC